MLCGDVDSFFESIVSGPAGASAFLNGVGERAARVGRDVERAALGLARARSTAWPAGCARRPRVLARLRGGVGDVGGDVLRVLARRRGWPASAAAACRSAGSICAVLVRAGGSGGARRPRTSSGRSRPARPAATPRRGSGPVDALGAGARERVAGAALLDEQLLAVDEVVAVVLELAARQREHARPRASEQPAEPVLRSWRGILLAGGAARAAGQGRGSAVQAALARRRSRSARRRPTSSARARRRRSPRACGRAASAGASSQRGEALGELRRPRPGRPRTSATAGPRAAPPRPARGATSARPEWPATTGSAPHAAASAATMPNASGNVLGIASASAAGSTSASSSCSSRPAQCTRSAMPLGRRAVRRRLGAERVEERGQLGQLAPVLAAQRPRGVEVAARERAREPLELLAEARRSRRRAAARPGRARARAARRRAAARRPWRRSACRRRRTIRSRAGSSAPSAAAASRRGRARTTTRRASAPPRCVGAARARVDAARAQPLEPAAASLGARGAKLGDVDAGRAEARLAPRSPGSSSAAHRLSAVWREPTSTPRAPARPSRAAGQEARVRLDRVLERAAVDLHRVRDAGARERPREDQRAHDEVVGQRDVRPRARERPRATAATLRAT